MRQYIIPPFVIPTPERSEEGGICLGRNQAMRQYIIPPFVIPTPERSEEGGICCSAAAPHQADRLSAPAC
jgi:hypothetical protein